MIPLQSSWETVHLSNKIDNSVCIVQDDDLHVDGLDRMLVLLSRTSTMFQQMGGKRKDVVVGFLVHICAISWLKVIIYSYAVRPALRISL